MKWPLGDGIDEAGDLAHHHWVCNVNWCSSRAEASQDVPLTNSMPRVVAIQQQLLGWVAISTMVPPWSVGSNAKAGPTPDMLSEGSIAAANRPSQQRRCSVEANHKIMAVDMLPVRMLS